MAMLCTVLPVIVMLLIGVLCREKNIIHKEAIGGLQALVMNFTLPAVLFSAFYKNEVTLDKLILPVALFTMTIGGIFLGKGICKLLHIKSRYLPYLMTGMEAGMIGYALFTIIFGVDNITAFAVADMGHGLAIFTVYVMMLKAEAGEKQTVSQMIKGVLKTPVFVAILIGVLFGTTGIGVMLAGNGAGTLIDTVCNFVSAPTSAVILVVIGYQMNFKQVKWGKILQAVGLRILVMGFMGTIVITIMKAIGGYVAEPLTIWSLVMLFILPPPFVLPLLVEKEEDKTFLSSTISVYTLVTIIGFVVVAGMALL